MKGYIDNKLAASIISELMEGLSPDQPINRQVSDWYRGYLLVLRLQYGKRPVVEVCDEQGNVLYVSISPNNAKGWVHQQQNRKRKQSERKEQKALDKMGLAEGLAATMSKKLLA